MASPIEALKKLKGTLDPHLYDYLITSEDLEKDVHDVIKTAFIPELDDIYKMCHKNKVVVTCKN